jgi:hypothetical protein
MRASCERGVVLKARVAVRAMPVKEERENIVIIVWQVLRIMRLGLLAV